MDEAEIRRRYAALEPRYKELANEVETALRSALERAAIKTSAIIYRVKELDSVLRKVARKQYADPFDQNDDFAGIRVVCLFTQDLDKVDAVIKSTFALLRAEDKSAALDVDRMGYEGRHYVVTLLANWSGHRYDALKGLPCEIQLRTICQDAWAQISRYLDYPTSDVLPPPVRRELFRMAYLLETAQISFDGVNEKRADYGRKVSAKEQPVDAFLLQSIDSETVKAYSLWKFPALGIKDNILQLFLRDLDRSKYRTLLDIDAVVEKARSFNDYYQRVRPDKYASGVDYLTKGFGYVDLDFRNKHPFAADTKKALAEFKPSAVEE